ncbi:MAG: exosortase/archaeosortase family protein [Candidatus Diapherotrites archaeon]
MAKKSAPGKKRASSFSGHDEKKVGKQRLKKELLASAKFLILFLIYFFIISIIFYFLPLEIFEFLTAKTTATVLEILGYSAEVLFGEPAKIIVNSKHNIEISYLCTGLLETTLIISAIAASAGISIKKRAIGALVGVAFVNALNILRIVATIVAIANLNDIGTVDFIHNVLFRVTLFVGIALYYAAWFFISTRDFSSIAALKRMLLLEKKRSKGKKQ